VTVAVKNKNGWRVVPGGRIEEWYALATGDV